MGPVEARTSDRRPAAAPDSVGQRSVTDQIFDYRAWGGPWTGVLPGSWGVGGSRAGRRLPIYGLWVWSAWGGRFGQWSKGLQGSDSGFMWSTGVN